MKKQEYQERLLCIKADNFGFRLLEGIKIRNQYIYSLEDEIEKLKADNLDLMKQVEINGKALDLACDVISKESCPYKQDICKTSEESLVNGCVQCWKEYFMQKAGENDIV